MGELQNNSTVDVKNALKSDNIQNHLIVNCFLLFEERLLYFKFSEILYRYLQLQSNMPNIFCKHYHEFTLISQMKNVDISNL